MALSSNVSEPVGNIDHHTFQPGRTPRVQERSFDEPGHLIVQDILPPAGGDKLGKYYDSEFPVIAFPVGFFQILQQGRDDGSIRGGDHDEWNIWPPYIPLQPQLIRAIRLQLYVDCADVGRNGLCKVHRAHHSAMNTRYGDHYPHRSVCWRWGKNSVQGKLLPDSPIVFADLVKRHHDQGKDQDRDPGTVKKFAGG